MAETARREFHTPIVTREMTPQEIRSAMREFGKRLNQDRIRPRKKRPHAVRLSYEEVIKVMRGGEPLPPQLAIVEGRRYVRLFDLGNPPSEALVRTNLERFISEVRNVVKGALREKKLGLIADMCREYEDGIKIADFFTKSGVPLSKNRAFSYAITQFFKDERLVLKIVRDCLQEYQKEMHSFEIPVAGTVKS